MVNSFSNNLNINMFAVHELRFKFADTKSALCNFYKKLKAIVMTLQFLFDGIFAAFKTLTFSNASSF